MPDTAPPPSPLRDLMCDVDSHEMIPAHLMGEHFGDIGANFARFLEERQARVQDFSPNSSVHPEVADDREITAEAVWATKGVAAPSAIDLGRREEVLDVMGISRQLVFPTFGLYGLALSQAGDLHFDALFQGQRLDDRREFGRSMIRASNDWLTRDLSVDTERVRVVAILPPGTVDELIAETRDLVDRGARALWMPAGIPPGGTSPANEALDPLWALAEERDVAIVLHIGTEFGFLDGRWRDSPAFASKVTSVEAPVLDTYTLSTVHYAAENFLTAMVLGGVFERFPALRFGVIETTATWVGPLARRLDLIARTLRPARPLPLTPSEYIARNVRVSPFWFEPIDEYFRDYPELSDVYCYSTDYPHVEGGSNSRDNCLRKIESFGPEIVDKYFTSNARLLLP